MRSVEPGPFPFDDDAFGLATTKDVVCHVPDKAAFFADIQRVLAPGAELLCADFFDNSGAVDDDAARFYEAYVDGMAAYGLDFHFRPQSDYERALAEAGFEIVELRDHTVASAAVAAREHAVLHGPDAAPILSALGDERFDARCRATEMRMRALKSRGLQHKHIRARKPA